MGASWPWKSRTTRSRVISEDGRLSLYPPCGPRDARGEVRNPIYLAIVVAWIAAVSFVVYRHRREGLPLTNSRGRAEPATETAS
jgi:protein-S-isoprenylcysteine O-methyltransferase Ste14